MAYERGYRITKSDSQKEESKKINVKYALVAFSALIAATSNEFFPGYAQEVAQTEHVEKKDREPTVVEQRTRKAPESIESFLERNNMQDALCEYWRGVRKLQYSAQQDTSELLSAFVVSPDGSFRWVDGELTEISNEQGDSVAVLYDIPDAFLENLYERAESGDRVVLFHTHPSYLLRKIQERKEDALRAPPGPTDMYAMLRHVQVLSPDAFNRFTFMVATEQKTWRYGFSSRETANQFADALSVGMELLEHANTEEMKEHALFLKNTLMSAFEQQPDSGYSISTEVETILRSGKFYERIKNNPRLLGDLNRVGSAFESLGVSVPEDAQQLLELFDGAHDETNEAFRKIDPSTDTNFSQPPIFGKFPVYVERWTKVGGFLIEESLLPAQDF